MFFIAIASIAFAENVKIDGAEIEWHKYYDNVFIKAEGFLKPKVSCEEKRIVLEFDGAQSADFAEVLKKSPRIKVVRSEKMTGNKCRVVIELKRNIKYDIASIYGKGIMVEISEDKNKPMAFASADKPVAVKNPLPNVETPELTVNVLEPINSAGTKNIEKPLKGKRIVVDPGHGGEDPGALSYDGTYEKALTLSTSTYLADYLASKGAKVFLTRKTDIKRSLPDIVDYSGKMEADVYIGVHYNSIDNKAISGTETYYYTPESFRLANLVHKQLLIKLKRTDRGVKRAALYTIHHSKIPAIIVEPVYITDMQESILVKSKAFQKEVAKAITQGVVDYFKR